MCVFVCANKGFELLKIREFICLNPDDQWNTVDVYLLLISSHKHQDSGEVTLVHPGVISPIEDLTEEWVESFESEGSNKLSFIDKVQREVVGARWLRTSEEPSQIDSIRLSLQDKSARFENILVAPLAQDSGSLEIVRDCRENPIFSVSKLRIATVLETRISLLKFRTKFGITVTSNRQMGVIEGPVDLFDALRREIFERTRGADTSKMLELWNQLWLGRLNHGYSVAVLENPRFALLDIDPNHSINVSQHVPFRINSSVDDLPRNGFSFEDLSTKGHFRLGYSTSLPRENNSWRANTNLTSKTSRLPSL